MRRDLPAETFDLIIDDAHGSIASMKDEAQRIEEGKVLLEALDAMGFPENGIYSMAQVDKLIDSIKRSRGQYQKENAETHKMEDTRFSKGWVTRSVIMRNLFALLRVDSSHSEKEAA